MTRGDRSDVVTNNQRRAVALARRLCAGEIEPGGLTEGEWHLLLLAAGVGDAHALPQLVGRRVLDRAARGLGYFVRHPDPRGTAGGAPA